MTVDEILLRLVDDLDMEIAEVVATTAQELKAASQVYDWAWYQATSRISLTAQYTAGTVDLTEGDATVSGTGTTFTSGMVGRKFRPNNGNGVYTIASYTSGTEIELDRVYSGDTVSDVTYSIYQDIYSFPTDMRRLIDLVNTVNGKPLRCAPYPAAVADWDNIYAHPESNSYPWEFARWKQASDGSEQFRLRYTSDEMTALDCHYLKWATAPTVIHSTLDCPSYMDEYVYYRVKRRYISRMPRTGEAAVIGRSSMLSECERDIYEAMKLAKREDARRMPAYLRNKRVVF